MPTWTLSYDKLKPEEEGLREALCTLGNGYFCTRGAAEWVDADHEVHYPGTYLAGGYNRLTTMVAGRPVENEDLVNMPNWLCLTFRVEGGEWLDLNKVDVLFYRQELNSKDGIMTRRLRFRDSKGRRTTLSSRRIVHMGKPHLAAIEWSLTPENWSGRMEVSSALDGGVVNSGVARYRSLDGRHLEPVESGGGGKEGIFLTVRTTQSRIEVAMAARTRVFIDDELQKVSRRTRRNKRDVRQILAFDVTKKRKVRIEKVVALYTSKDHAITEPSVDARTACARAESFDELLRGHSLAWHQLWRRCDIVLTGDTRHQMILRVHIFHLLQTVSRNVIELDVGVPARGLHGEAYRGHIFWDELFIFPFLNFRVPEITHALLLYRFRRLDEARAAAKEAGFRGAMFPWQSGSNGREETQSVHLNPRSGEWDVDLSRNQRHVNIAIAYNIWEYYQATRYDGFMSVFGAEMMFEIARFWASVAHYNPERERYEIHGVMGPDEYHEKYPGSNEPGLRNNAYTNIMVAWVLDCALKVLDSLLEYRRAELREMLDLTDEEISRWADISRRMFVPFHDDGIISQFEGYEKLKEFDWSGYRKKYGDVGRLDRILKAENDTPDRYKLSKQADVLMLFYLFSENQLRRIFEGLDYPFPDDAIPKNIEYYMRRTSHGSTLSTIVGSAVTARYNGSDSWRLFCEALESDVGDIQQGTTPEGIHLGAMAGTVDLVQRVYTGLEIRDGILFFDPKLPDQIKAIDLSIRYCGMWMDLKVTNHTLTISPRNGTHHAPVKVGIRDQVYFLKPGYRRRFKLGNRT